MKQRILDDHSFDVLFREARTHRAWKEGDVTEVLVRAVYDLMKWGPTSANCSPARFVFVKSKEAKERLKPHLDQGNVEKTMTAPVTAIIAHDMKFYEKMGQLAPHMKDGAKMFTGGGEKAILENAMRNGTLQGGYFIIAARALGLDCGPMSGFNKEGVKKEFLESDWEPNFLCNIGYGDESKIFPRAPRLGFDEACKIV